MIELFHQRGMSREDAEVVITRMAKYKDFFVNIMMTEASTAQGSPLHALRPSTRRASPRALVTARACVRRARHFRLKVAE
jgi:hypothetical protein